MFNKINSLFNEEKTSRLVIIEMRNKFQILVKKGVFASTWEFTK